ncbi:MAG: saccharopine dehydrogenase NADP-binding domain-containing protein [Deltaproteobacteria bacterium]|nr:saccharopine dehydrogenase NADP-binding domain-containing protein [Deltaproteobacteria bacterium]
MARPLRLLVLGAAGQMTSVATQIVCAADPDLRVTLVDRDAEALARLEAQLGSGRAEATALDLFDEPALCRALDGVDFLINGAGPFHRTAGPVMRACIDAGASYMDIDDDVESTLEAIELDGAARLAGVTLYVGHGASPGLSNVLALDAMRRLDEPQEVEVAWCVGESGGGAIGRAVAEHTLHIGAGEFTGWRNGKRRRRESFAQSTLFPLADPPGACRLYECAHPEPVMLGFSHPRLRDVVCWGGLHPAPLNGALRGIAVAVREGRLGIDDACAFLQSGAHAAGRRDDASAAAGPPRGARAARFAMHGILRQVLRRECSPREAWATLRPRRGGARPQPVSGIGARVRGLRGGRPAEVVVSVRLDAHAGAAGETGSMAAATGACEAAFFQLARAGGAAPGVVFPEMWVEPAAFYAALGVIVGAVPSIEIA